MIIRPIIPIPLMIIITIILLVLIVISSKKAKLLVRILIVLFLFLINLRPMILDGDVEVLHSNIDMVFVIDTTLSMDAQDYDGSKRRLEGVSKDIEYIMKKIPGAYYSVITFDNKTTIKLPLTADANAILIRSPTINGTTPMNNNSGILNAEPVFTSIVLYNPIKPGTYMHIKFAININITVCNGFLAFT